MKPTYSLYATLILVALAMTPPRAAACSGGAQGPNDQVVKQLRNLHNDIKVQKKSEKRTKVTIGENLKAPPGKTIRSITTPIRRWTKNKEGKRVRTVVQVKVYFVADEVTPSVHSLVMQYLYRNIVSICNGKCESSSDSSGVRG